MPNHDNAMIAAKPIRHEDDDNIIFSSPVSKPHAKVIAVGRVRHGAVAIDKALPFNALPVAAMVSEAMFTDETPVVAHNAL